MDLRTGAFDVPPQEILTRDSVTINVDAVVYYQVNSVNSEHCATPRLSLTAPPVPGVQPPERDLQQ